MTVASEITRLQTAKSDIKTAIEWKWVSVASDAKLDAYPSLINQIKTSTGAELFVPSSLTIANAVRNSNASASVTNDIRDVVSPDWTTYYHYFWFRNSTTTAFDAWSVGAFKKIKWSNPTLITWPSFPENNYYYNYVQRNVATRVKIDWNDVKMSTLAFREFDSNGLQTHWGKVTLTLYCVNATNNTFSELITLWSIWDLPDKYGYNFTDVPNWNELWTASCWMTDEDTIASVGYTTLSFTSASWSYYNLVAALNV